MDEEADQTEDVSLDEPMDTDTDELTEEEKRRRSFNPLSGEYTYP